MNARDVLSPGGTLNYGGFTFYMDTDGSYSVLLKLPDPNGGPWHSGYADLGFLPGSIQAWAQVLGGNASGITDQEAALTNAAQQANNQAVAVAAAVTTAVAAGTIAANDPAVISAQSAVRTTSQNLALTISKANIDPAGAQQKLNDSQSAVTKAAQFATSAGLDVTQAVSMATGLDPNVIFWGIAGFLLYRAMRKNG